MKWVDEDGAIIADGTARQFFMWLHGTAGMTKSIFKNCLAWFQGELNHQLESKRKDARPSYICNLVGAKALKEEVR